MEGHHLGKAEFRLRNWNSLVLLTKNALYVNLLQASDSGDLGCGFHFLITVSAFISAMHLLFIMMFYLILVWHCF